MKKLCAILLAMTFILAGIQAVRACCIYNHTDYPLDVDGNYKTKVSSSSHKCTDGTGVSVGITLLAHDGNKFVTKTVNVEVDDHGWLSVYKKESGKWKAVVKDRRGKVQDVNYLHPLSN